MPHNTTVLRSGVCMGNGQSNLPRIQPLEQFQARCVFAAAAPHDVRGASRTAPVTIRPGRATVIRPAIRTAGAIRPASRAAIDAALRACSVLAAPRRRRARMADGFVLPIAGQVTAG